MHGISYSPRSRSTYTYCRERRSVGGHDPLCPAFLPFLFPQKGAYSGIPHDLAELKQDLLEALASLDTLFAVLAPELGAEP